MTSPWLAVTNPANCQMASMTTRVNPPTTCPLCGTPTPSAVLAEVSWTAPAVLSQLVSQNPNWQRADGACPACVQQVLLQVLLEQGDIALHQSIQTVWPLDAEAAFGALPTPLRLHADPRYTGRGVTLALVDSGFYPHPDLIQPANRIRAWVDASRDPVQVYIFNHNEQPKWPGWDAAHPAQWHGLMTSTVAAGNGWLSHGLYRGLASEADLVLIQVRDETGHISSASITRALRWLHEAGPELQVRVVSLSVAGDPVEPLADNPVDETVAALVANNMTVIAAAGNDGQRCLIPPATAPEALTIGGLDDKNTFDHHDVDLWHSNYGQGIWGVPKPELVAPSIWVVAPLLPNTGVASEARQLFGERVRGNPQVENRLAALKLVTPYYQHVEGTSFAAPLVASAAACLLEANPQLTPRLIREILVATAHHVPGAPPERQGAGAIEVGSAVALALRERHGPLARYPLSPQASTSRITFLLHDHTAQQVTVLGSWNNWSAPGLTANEVEPGIWQAHLPPLEPGRYSYKFLLDGTRWLDDSANPRKQPNGLGGFNSLLIV
jgi:serine protease AprX